MDPPLLSQVDCDPRMHALGVVLKRWGKARRVLDAARGTLSTYALHLMLVFFLQNSQPQPVLPCLQPTRGTAGSGERAGCSVRQDAAATDGAVVVASGGAGSAPAAPAKRSEEKPQEQKGAPESVSAHVPDASRAPSAADAAPAPETKRQRQRRRQKERQRLQRPQAEGGGETSARADAAAPSGSGSSVRSKKSAAAKAAETAAAAAAAACAARMAARAGAEEAAARRGAPVIVSGHDCSFLKRPAAVRPALGLPAAEWTHGGLLAFPSGIPDCPRIVCRVVSTCPARRAGARAAEARLSYYAASSSFTWITMAHHGVRTLSLSLCTARLQPCQVVMRGVTQCVTN